MMKKDNPVSRLFSPGGWKKADIKELADYLAGWTTGMRTEWVVDWANAHHEAWLEYKTDKNSDGCNINLAMNAALNEVLCRRADDLEQRIRRLQNED